MDGSRDAYSVDEFCKRHDISRAYIYQLWKRGTGPRFMQLGGKRLISVEAAADWRRQMERSAHLSAA